MPGCPPWARSYGTASIAAPELLSEGRLTKASDIYGKCSLLGCACALCDAA